MDKAGKSRALNFIQQPSYMKHLIIYALLFLGMLACQTPASNEEAPITLEEKMIAMNLVQGSFDDLWGGLDSTKILDYHTKDYIILEQGSVWDNDRIKQFMRNQLAKPDRPKRINTMEYISIDKYGPSMQIAWFNHADFMRADTLSSTANWLESAVAIETPDGWRLKMMHSTWVGNDK